MLRFETISGGEWLGQTIRGYAPGEEALMKRNEEMGCSCLTWTTEGGVPLWGRNFDLNLLPPDSQVTFLPPGTAYTPGGPGATAMEARWGAVGVGTLSVPGSPMLYEGVNQMGLMGGQLNYRDFARYPAAPRPGTTALPPGGAVYHLLAQCASVEEVVRLLETEATITAVPLLGVVPTVHWAFADETGESVVIEPEAEGLRIYRNALGVMTNSPGYLWQRTNLLNYAGVRDLDHGPVALAAELEPCFSGTGGQGLPGDWSSPSRFVRLAFLRQYARPGRTEAEGVARLFRLLQSAAFPLGAVRLEEAEAGGAPWEYTIYTAVACARSRRFYWTTYENQRVRYVELPRLVGRGIPARFPLGNGTDFQCLTDL